MTDLARLLVATTHRGKLRELSVLLSPLGVQVVGADDVGVLPEVIEDGETFEHNARKKAREIAAVTGMMVLADDSGLEVDVLGGAPGVRSARYAGQGAGDAANNARLLDALAQVPPRARTARFCCVLAFADPRGPLGRDVHIARGRCEGRIAVSPRGAGGFGYDPLFVTADGRTMAELAPEEKSARSHRGAATAAMRDFLAGYLRTRGASRSCNEAGFSPRQRTDGRDRTQ